MKRFLELFAGIGLVRLGLESCGWKCVYANDLDADKETFYRLNFKDDHFHLKDIWKVEHAELPPKVELITASFPCTDLSLAGNRKGLAGEHSGTYWAFINILKGYHKSGAPIPAVMIENVPGFLTSRDGQDFIDAIKALNELGYATDVLVLDAKYFVPQSRQRVFVIGMQRRLADKVMVLREQDLLDFWGQRLMSPTSLALRPEVVRKIMKTHKELTWGLIDLPMPPVNHKRLHDIVEDIPYDDKRWWSEDRAKKLVDQMSEKHLESLQKMLKHEGHKYATVYRRKRKDRSMAEMRTDGLSGCLRTPRGGSSRQILVDTFEGKVHVRLVSGREYARLQGVKDSFKIPDDELRASFGFGDAVCVPAIEWIAHNVFSRVFVK
jgi:DNA (cytosine-5)-methyltransferase 1